MFSGLIPEHVFELWAQWDNGNNYVEFVKEGNVVTDRARPFSLRVDLVPLISQLNSIPVLEYVEYRPSEIRWDAWDWQLMKQKPGGYTDVNLVLHIRSYVDGKAMRWWAAGGQISPERQYFYRADRMDHYNHVIVDYPATLAFIEQIKLIVR